MQNFQVLFFKLSGLGRKVEALNVSTFRASGFPKVGACNVPTFGFSPRFQGLSIDARAAKGGPGANLQYTERTVDTVDPKNW